MPDKRRIFDTVTISNFLLSDATIIIENRYRQHALITSQVLDEISTGFTKYPILKIIDTLIDNGTLSICNMSLKERRVYNDLNGHLGKGEASCIAIADNQGWVVVTDDRAARRVCSQMGISVTGTIGIIKAAFHDGQITLKQANDILKRMTDSGFYSPIRKIDDLK